MPGKLVQAWSEGLQAGRRGEPDSLNPHPRGTELAGHWYDGWRQGTAQARDMASLQTGSPDMRFKTTND